MNKNTTVNVILDDSAYGIFQDASEIVFKAGIRVPPGQLVQTMINAEISRLSARKIAQRFLKSIMRQVGTLARTAVEEEIDDDQIPEIPSQARATEFFTPPKESSKGAE